MSDSQHVGERESAALGAALVIASVSIEISAGELTAQKDIDALVILTDAQLVPISLAGQNVHARAGAQLTAQCRAAVSSLAPSDAVIATGAFELPIQTIIHCRKPVGQWHPRYVEELSERYRRVIHIAEARGLRRIALEPMRSGSGVAAVGREVGVMVSCITNLAQPLQHLRLLRFMLTDGVPAQMPSPQSSSTH